MSTQLESCVSSASRSVQVSVMHVAAGLLCFSFFPAANCAREGFRSESYDGLTAPTRGLIGTQRRRDHLSGGRVTMGEGEGDNQVFGGFIGFFIDALPAEAESRDIKRVT